MIYLCKAITQQQLNNKIMNQLEKELNDFLIPCNGDLEQAIVSIENAMPYHETQLVYHSSRLDHYKELIELAKAKFKEQQRIQDLDQKIEVSEKKKHDDFIALIESLPEGEPREEPTIEEQEQILWGQHQEEMNYHKNQQK